MTDSAVTSDDDERLPACAQREASDDSTQQVTEVIARLAEAFPRCFFLDEASRRPLKLDIHVDLVTLVPFAEEELRAGLAYYTRANGYLCATVEGAPRIDLNGNEVDTVSAKHAAWAQMILVRRQRSKDKRREKRQKKAIADRVRQTKRTQPQRAGFSELRASAARRREA
jgi:sRNA-binding protein